MSDVGGIGKADTDGVVNGGAEDADVVARELDVRRQ